MDPSQSAPGAVVTPRAISRPACQQKESTLLPASIGVTYRGPKELGRTVEVYAAAFPDMHRELYAFYVVGDTVVVELALQGTHKSFNCYPSGTVVLSQLGVLQKLEARPGPGHVSEP